MYWVVLVGSTEKTTELFRVVQLPSCVDTWIKSTADEAASHWLAPAAIADTTRL
jgi:hypothetical protein